MHSNKLSRRTALKAGAALWCTPLASAKPRQDSTVPPEREGPLVRIAVVQQETIAGAVQENRALALRFLGEALDQKADIVVYHEALIVGYVDNIHELAEEANGPSARAFQEVLTQRESDALVLFGNIERDGTDIYTSATLVSRDGVVANYRKTHLWWAAGGVRHEPSFFKPGTELVTFELRGYKCGVMICYDGDFPEMTRSYANLDCSILFWLNNRTSRGHGEARNLAERNSMIIATSCVCGDDESGLYCGGGSNITDQEGHLLEELWDQAGVILADVSPASVLEDRQKNPGIHGQRQELYR